MIVTKLSFLVLTRFLVLGGVVFLGFGQCAKCQDVNDYSDLDNPAILQLATQLVYSRILNLTVLLNEELNNRSSFCIKSPAEDWNRAFNFSTDPKFLVNCIQRTNGDILRRICTAAEMKFYFNNLFETSVSSNYLKPNRNCNLTSWVSGCEPGWACRVGVDQNVDLRDAKDIPSRTDGCQACCEGFFCPYGLTCMIPCPLGSYCPLATPNSTTGICEPYTYQLPPKDPNHTCGGANIWADVGRSKEMFCSSGSYCPSTVKEIRCRSGRYCRMGSTSEIPCFKLASCNSNTTNQNIHAYGIMLIVALSTLLLIIYNCSDQLINTRTRRMAKSREAAARSARETTRARQRWKAAKEAAMKHASELQSHLSLTFSRQNFSASSDGFQMLDQDHYVENDIYPPHHPSSSSTSMPSEGDIRGTSIPMKEMHEIQEDSHQDEGFNHGSSYNKKKKKGNIPTAKDMRTHSQIFKYAYAQLEKEKEKEKTLEDKNLTFSGVISMATDSAIKKRPLIEVYFKDITLTLKGKNKHLLRSVTGVLKPGRITAVMGPSGAGKTSFLSALAGKAVGCSMTGMILINGRNVSIHSYKKITGFVPQDDIVHGNLTVEENLWFSAKCRLPASMPKADKVLILERVIESLGLQSVRDSLVGTVEKRGISGGQRKRVNVGLEMVMEPSLLILDEPTSGLDSASSQLLLRALRHEALEGVNICMVVHQPSYTLFRMFDDLILLAKGGLVVYHGPAKQVEDYFTGLGITVPERVNPPDHFIDILEGIVTPSSSSGVSHKELPVTWMIHNGYPIPPDMRKDAGFVMSSTNANIAARINSNGEMSDQSFAGELWQDVRSNMEMHRDNLRLNFLKSTDLSHRRTPGVFFQYRYYLGRIVKQRLRDSKVQAIDYIILLLAGACLGTLSKAGDENFGAPGYTYTIIAVSLLCKIAALRSFSLEKLQYWRESASGVSSFAYFLANDTVDHFNTVIKPVVYLSMFYFFTNPRSSFADNYTVMLCLVYCVTGFGYALAIFFKPGAAQLWSVLLPVVFTLLATQSKGSNTIKTIANFCYPKWALEAFIISNAERYYGVWLITRCGALLQNGYDLRDWNTCLTILIVTGLFGRGLAFIGMLMFQKK